MNAPILKQFSGLAAQDFDSHPIWIGCHTVDYDQPWYDDTDEETFRPRPSPLPADPSEGMLLVRATATLWDGSQLSGFLTPALKTGDLGTMQPHVFVAGRMWGFWGGILGVPEAKRRAFLNAAAKTVEQVFPVRFEAPRELSNGVVRVEVTGWQVGSRDDMTAP